MANLNLARVPRSLQDRARECLEAGDLLGMLCIMDNRERVLFVDENILCLWDAGILEQAVIYAWSSVLVNSAHMESIFEFLFGHYVGKHSWSRLFHDYNILEGRLWSLVLMAIALAPYVMFRIRL